MEQRNNAGIPIQCRQVLMRHRDGNWPKVTKMNKGRPGITPLIMGRLGITNNVTGRPGITNLITGRPGTLIQSI